MSCFGRSPYSLIQLTGLLRQSSKLQDYRVIFLCKFILGIILVYFLVCLGWILLKDSIPPMLIIFFLLIYFFQEYSFFFVLHQLISELTRILCLVCVSTPFASPPSVNLNLCSSPFLNKSHGAPLYFFPQLLRIPSPNVRTNFSTHDHYRNDNTMT